jgi:soluble lytic murein transglycosylase-like protein
VPEFTPLVKNQVKGISIKIADAIKQVETGGNYNARGLSGEKGAYQFMPSTYNSLSKKYFGEILPMTPDNQRKVALAVIDDMVNKGYTKEQIALYWNSGQTKRCSSGVNRWGVKFDSCAYVQKVVAHIK